MKLSTRIILAFSLVIFLSVADSYTNFLLTIKVAENINFLSQSESNIRNSSKTHKHILEMQGAFRGYLITLDSTFLDPFNEGIRQVPQLLAYQESLVTNSPKQLALIDSIRTKHNEWLQFARALIRSIQKSTFRDSTDLEFNALMERQFRLQVGKQLNDAITARFIEMDSIEYRVRDVHSRQLRKSIEYTQLTSSIFLAATILVGIVSAVYIIALIIQRISSMVKQAEQISKGEFTTIRVSGNDELTSLSKSLNAMSQQLNKNIIELQNRNAELNKYAYVVSHDLKAPVRGIHNVISWIEEDIGSDLSPELKNYLRIISERTQRMEDLINGLLNYARISETTPEEKIDTRVLIDELVSFLVPRHFAVHIHDMPVMTAERIKLEQVFSNLISNAVKYNNSEAPTLEIHCRLLPGKYEFSVTDNGIGIDKEYHEKIFDIFQTLRAAHETESTGIGLAIVKKIIDEQHGQIAVKSAEGEGSTFTFTWPRRRSDE